MPEVSSGTRQLRETLVRFRGREVNTSGDGFLAMFDGPQRAIRCAMAIRDAVQALGIEVRAGLHTGECEVRGDDQIPGPADPSFNCARCSWRVPGSARRSAIPLSCKYFEVARWFA